MPNEICIICGSETNVDVNTHIDYRYGYVEGAGQCCKECYDKTYGTPNDYVAKVMKNRTTLITISAEDILNTPNDMELGAKLRRRYWEITGEQPETKNEWVCKYCGEDTSGVEYDYLAGTDHISCILAIEMKVD
jgi:hypothetical protein